MASLRGFFTKPTYEKVDLNFSAVEVLSQFLQSLNNNLKNHTSIVKQRYVQSLTRFADSGLSECACESHNRLENNRRLESENTILQTAKERFHEAKELSVLSFGSGKLLQDFILSAKLLLEGFSIDLTLIESQNDAEFQMALKALKLLKVAASELNLTFKVTNFETLYDFRDAFPNKKIHIATVIDFDYWHYNIQPMALLYQMLNENGFLIYDGRVCKGIPFRIMYNRKQDEMVLEQPEVRPFLKLNPMINQLVNISNYSQPDEKFAAQRQREIIQGTGGLPQRAIKTIIDYSGLYEHNGLLRNTAIRAEIDQFEETITILKNVGRF